MIDISLFNYKIYYTSTTIKKKRDFSFRAKFGGVPQFKSISV